MYYHASSKKGLTIYVKDAYEAIIEAEKQGMLRILRYSEISEKRKEWLKQTINLFLG